MTPRQQEAISYFVSMGWSPAQAAGIVANLHAESGLRPDAVGDGGQAYGIAQWHPPRQAGFEALLGKPIRGSSFEDQLRWVHAELLDTEKAAGDALRACTTAADAGACVSKMYERPKDREGEAAKRAVLAAQLAGEQPQAPIEDRSTTYQPPRGSRMDPFSILSIFGPALMQAIPQLGKLFVKPEDTRKQQNLETITLVLDTFAKAALNNQQASGTNLAQMAQAVENVQKDPVLKQEVVKTVLTTPGIMELVEIGGGVAKAREHGIAIQNADKPFWYNPVVWVTVLFFPMMYMITYQVLFTLAGPVMIASGVEAAPLVAAPWYAQIGFDPNTRTGLINLIVGFVFGGVCGIWFGTTVARQRAENTAATQVIEDRRQS